MTANQYSVLTQSRPQRVAFLINSDQFAPSSVEYHALLDTLVDWSNSHWGGRQSHISCYSGETLANSQWRELEIADPDYIVAFSAVSDRLVREVDERVTPLSFEVHEVTKAERLKVSIPIVGIGMSPTVGNLKRLAARNIGSFGSQPGLLMFQFSEECDADIRRFVHRNFGTFHQWRDHKGTIRRIAWLEHLLPDIRTHTLAVSDIDSLGKTLTIIAGRIDPPNIQRSLDYVAPYQLASLFLDCWPRGELDHTYQLIVGDSTADFEEHWNGIRRKRNWMETHKHQLWIPKSLLSYQAFRLSLHDWLWNYANPGSGQQRIELLSESLCTEEASEIQNFFKQHKRPLHLHVVLRDKIENRRQLAAEAAGQVGFVPLSYRGDVNRFSALSRNETFTIPKPEPLQQENRDGSWIVDVQIDYIPTVTRTIRGQSWWRLPRRNSRNVVDAMFRQSGRISRQGHFSVCVSSQESQPFQRVKPELRFDLPTETTLIHWLVADPHGRRFGSADARKQLRPIEPIVTDCRISTKGRYLAGLIDLFGNFWIAQEFCQRRFWRDLFNQLAGYGKGKDEKLQHQLVDILSNAFADEDTTRKEKATVLADTTLHLVRGRLKGHYIRFKDCVQRRSKLEKKGLPEQIVYLQGDTVVESHGEKPVSFQEMQTGLNDLIKLGVLRLGIETACPRCNLSSWYHVDDLHQDIRCTGCGTEYSLKATELWSYSLNSLAQTSISQGVIGVLQALTALESVGRSFFAFSPSLDLFRKNENAVWHEVDILCIADGEFIIGEVKEGHARKSDFDTLIEVAEALQPQRAVICLPMEKAEEQWTDLDRWLKESQTKLKSKDVKVELFTLPSY